MCVCLYLFLYIHVKKLVTYFFTVYFLWQSKNRVREGGNLYQITPNGVSGQDVQRSFPCTPTNTSSGFGYILIIFFVLNRNISFLGVYLSLMVMTIQLLKN